MKKYLALAAAASLALTSCEDFLDSENYTQANSKNYPASAKDLNTELAALYGVMNQYVTDPLNTYFMVNNLMSDDCNGAGGTGDVECHAVAHLTMSKESLYDLAWHSTYVGIARANAIISSVDAFDWTGQEDTRSQLLGEAYFMRGLFYMWGAQFWGDIPAYWADHAPDPCPQQSAEEVIYPHILADFLSAYNLMQAGKTTQGDGHATKWAAAGYLARAYMFYEGFYKKAGELATASLADVVLPEQEGISGNLTKAQVVAALEDAMKNSGLNLISDYRRLWQYSNELSAPDYEFMKDLVENKDLADDQKYWAGNGNEEQLFQIQFANLGSWSGTISMGWVNQISLYCGLRCDDDGSGNINGDETTLPFGQGWGQGTINANLWEEWPDDDPRKRATILDAQSECKGFVFTTSCTEDAGYYNKKVMSITCARSTFSDMATAYTWWGVYRSENTDKANKNGSSMQGDHFTDLVLMRLADIYLMHTELTGNAEGMNKVRKRVGLPEKGYSWENIQNERRWEFAGEGLRFNDLRRWSGKNGGESCLAAVALEKQNGTRVNYTGRWTTMHHATSSWAKRYAETDGFLPIPPSQINIVADEAVLKQNAGWGSGVADANMSGTPKY
ncbi:MAG: RagB/SusD family nutrient uptake outer membrane protein [Bacteroidales bacterium]|nr:RagB/SusD family nutrient uptake outer membrane protein [Bacteroidales bacterium]